jgi:hypothetical protein
MQKLVAAMVVAAFTLKFFAPRPIVVGFAIATGLVILVGYVPILYRKYVHSRIEARIEQEEREDEESRPNGEEGELPRNEW